MDENFAYWSASFQRAGKRFSLSLSLGTDVVANITDRLFSDIPCYHDRARCRRPSYLNPHGGPITHNSTGSKPDSHVHPCLPKLSLTLGFVCNSRATLLWSVLLPDAILTLATLNPFLTLVQTSSNYLSAWTLLLYLRTSLSMYFICSTREIILCSFMG